jgi:anaerobic ribonucleoside-triphosphate reductase activating protein
MFDAGAGRTISIDAVLEAIDASRRVHRIEGVSVLGGEPLQQIQALIGLARKIAARDLGLVVFTGYTLEEAQALAGFDQLVSAVDTLVDGRFDARRLEPEHGRGVVGSSNQRLIHFTPRYADPRLWEGPPMAEVVIEPGGVLNVVGSPGTVRHLLRALPR